MGRRGASSAAAGGVAVQVIILGGSDRSGDGRAMAAALQAIADGGGPAGFDDPVAWQGEARAERTLPGREDG